MLESRKLVEAERPFAALTYRASSFHSRTLQGVNATIDEWRRKVDCLSRPATDAPRPLSVEIIETHFAVVFLAGAFVYKLKKPLRFREFDFTTLEARRADCELELALNRRLTEVGTATCCAHNRCSTGMADITAKTRCTLKC